MLLLQEDAAVGNALLRELLKEMNL